MSLNRLLKEAFLFSSICLIIGCEKIEKADLVIHNGTLYTMEESSPTAEAVAVTGGKIVSVGSNNEIKKMIGKQTEVIDLRGKTMTPGFIESHGHFLSFGKAKMRLGLNNIKNYDELVKLVEEAVKKAKPGEWILGRGWHQSKWEPRPDPMVRGFQTHQALSRVSPDNPVFLTHASGHAGFANARAMEIAGITGSTKCSGDGEVIKDKKGNPTGILVEAAEDLVSKRIPESTPDTERRAAEYAMNECLAHGITTFHDALSTKDNIDLYKELLNEGKMKVRLWLMINGVNEKLLEEYYGKGPQVGLGNNFLTIRAIKLLSDGALGSRGAWLLEPYSDRRDHYGHEIILMDYVYSVAKDALKHGFQLCVHAIGDRANREVLDQYEKAIKENPEASKDHRFRIEHAQHLTAQDIPRFAQLGIIPAMQAIHMSSDRPWAIDRLGKKRIEEGAYVWQKLLQSGARIANGTDVPVEPISPVACFYASVTRRTLKGEPPGGYEADQKMTREQALRSYTLDAAYAGFEEKIKGSIEIGKLADFTVFSQDIMKVPDDDLLKTVVECTIIDGKVAYRKE